MHTEYPNPYQIKTGFTNRKGAWLKELADNKPKLKHWTSVMEVNNNVVWGHWQIGGGDSARKVIAPVETVEPHELADALGSIAEKYNKARNKGQERPVIYSGSCLKGYAIPLSLHAQI